MVISHRVICFGLEDDTLDLGSPRNTRSLPRHTLTGCDLASICANLGLPGSGPRLFHLSLVDPFGKPGWHAAVYAAARPRPAIGMERAATCGGAEVPSPSPTRLHISAGFPSGFLSCFQSNHPQNLSFRGFLGSAVSPAPTWAGLGRARSIHPHSYFRSRSSAGRAALHHQPSNHYPPRQQFATILKVVTFLQPSSRTHPDTAVPVRGESDRIFGISLLSFFLWLGYAMTNRDRETQNTSHTWSLGSVTIITGTLEGILASSGFWFFKRAIFCHISSHLFYT